MHHADAHTTIVSSTCQRVKSQCESGSGCDLRCLGRQCSTYKTPVAFSLAETLAATVKATVRRDWGAESVVRCWGRSGVQEGIRALTLAFLMRECNGGVVKKSTRLVGSGSRATGIQIFNYTTRMFRLYFLHSYVLYYGHDMTPPRRATRSDRPQSG
ncbi:hypothetical protein EI94DRAFT_634048 [Lactarius quietus]|nr:hypothetical protein EI94DRAFT_634048 [Lactarius quietus]